MPPLPNEIVDDPRYRALTTRRDEAARRARGAQSSYRWLTRAFIAATAVSAIGSALTLYGMETPGSISAALHAWVSDAGNRRVLLLLVAAALALAAFAQHQLRTSAHGDEWTRARGEAERHRLERERVALRIGHERGPAAFREAGLGFQRFLEGQIRHHRDSADRHRASSRSLGLLAAAMAAVVALAGGLAAAGNGTVVIAVALIGVCAPALAAALKSWSEATGDVQRAELHAITWDNLVAEQGRMPELMAAVDAGDLDAALGHAERVLKILENDNLEFRELRAAPAPG